MERINHQELFELLCYVGKVLESKKSYLTDLDSAIGDGDFGISMSLGFGEIQNFPPDVVDAGISSILKNCGMAFANKAPSTIGALFATGFLRAAAVLDDAETIDSTSVVKALSAAAEGILQRGKAQLGDKTLLDALLPALTAASTLETKELTALFNTMASAADQGSQSTKDMRSVKGRSRWLQDRSVGHIDPGAEAIAIICRACADWVGGQKEDYPAA